MGTAARGWRGGSPTPCGGDFRCRGPDAGAATVWAAGDVQPRAGQPVHPPGVQRGTAGPGGSIRRDGQGRARDHIFGKRLGRCGKYEQVYPQQYARMQEAREGYPPTSGSPTRNAPSGLGEPNARRGLGRCWVSTHAVA